MRRLTALLTMASILAPVACLAQQAPTVEQMLKTWHIKPTDQRGPHRGMNDDDDDAAGTAGSTAPAVAATRPVTPPRAPAPAPGPAHVASAKAPEAPTASVAMAPAPKPGPVASPSGGDAPELCSAATGTCTFDLPFPSGSAELTPTIKSLLDRFGQVLQNPDAAPLRFKIEGHTDTVGNRDFNQTLSLQRARAVAAYLEARYGVDASRLVPDGKGKDNLPVPTPDQTPEQKNRVVLIFPVSA